MTTGEYSPLLRNGNNRINATQHHLAISAHYYDITDIESWPIAGLLVLLDGQMQPVRAELHLDENLEPHVQDAAIRQARLVLQEKYLGGVPVPVRILESLQTREEMIVRLPPVGARSLNFQTMARGWRPNGMVGAAALALIAVIWIAIALMGRDATPESPSTATDAAGIATDVSNAPAGDVEEVQADAAADAPAEAPATTIPAANLDLPPSRNARGDLGIGVPVQVTSGLRLALRSEAGADAGIVIGEMTEGVEAIIIGGPQYTPGDSDTIVWWFVELADGTQAWAAANTSQQTLLMPAE